MRSSETDTSFDEAATSWAGDNDDTGSEDEVPSSHICGNANQPHLLLRHVRRQLSQVLISEIKSAKDEWIPDRQWMEVIEAQLWQVIELMSEAEELTRRNWESIIGDLTSTRRKLANLLEAGALLAWDAALSGAHSQSISGYLSRTAKSCPFGDSWNTLRYLGIDNDDLDSEEAEAENLPHGQHPQSKNINATTCTIATRTTAASSGNNYCGSVQTNVTPTLSSRNHDDEDECEEVTGPRHIAGKRLNLSGRGEHPRVLVEETRSCEGPSSSRSAYWKDGEHFTCRISTVNDNKHTTASSLKGMLMPSGRDAASDDENDVEVEELDAEAASAIAKLDLRGKRLDGGLFWGVGESGGPKSGWRRLLPVAHPSAPAFAAPKHSLLSIYSNRSEKQRGNSSTPLMNILSPGSQEGFANCGELTLDVASQLKILEGLFLEEARQLLYSHVEGIKLHYTIRALSAAWPQSPRGGSTSAEKPFPRKLADILNKTFWPQIGRWSTHSQYNSTNMKIAESISVLSELGTSWGALTSTVVKQTHGGGSSSSSSPESDLRSLPAGQTWEEYLVAKTARSLRTELHFVFSENNCRGCAAAFKTFRARCCGSALCSKCFHVAIAVQLQPSPRTRFQCPLCRQHFKDCSDIFAPETMMTPVCDAILRKGRHLLSAEGGAAQDEQPEADGSQAVRESTPQRAAARLPPQSVPVTPKVRRPGSGGLLGVFSSHNNTLVSFRNFQNYSGAHGSPPDY